MKTKKTFFEKIKEVWHQDKPTEQEIKVSRMLSILFEEQTTEQVIDTLILFDEKAKIKLQEIKKQAETDRFVTDFYLGTNVKNKVTI